MNKLNVAILYGGTSLEKDVSVITGLQVIQNINKQKYKIYPIYIDTNGIWWHTPKIKKIEDLHNVKKQKVYIKTGENYFYFNLITNNKIKIHCAINCLHGGYGENGAISSMLEMCKIPSNSSNITSCNSTLNKYLTKIILEKNNFNVLPYILLNKDALDNNKLTSFININSFPIVVKPIDMGSSIGVTFAENMEDLEKGLKLVFSYCNYALIEKGIKKVTEYNCSAMQAREKLIVSEVEKPIKKSSILTYAEKYGSKGFNKLGCKTACKGFSSLGREFPAKISKNLTDKIKNLTYNAYTLFNCSGIVRCDYIYYNKKLYLNEINSIPGSLSFYLWSNSGYSFETLIDNLITTSILKFNQKQ